MALQEKFIACGPGLTVFGMVLRFIAGPAAMAIGAIAVGLHGNALRVAIIQVIFSPHFFFFLLFFNLVNLLVLVFIKICNLFFLK
jgi:hypothetical protein